jgi:hypothetical protein
MEALMRRKSQNFSFVTSKADSENGGTSRRKLLTSVLWAAALANAATLFGTSEAARAQPKVSKEQAKYQDTPKDDQKCSGCTYFVNPNSCKLVDGEIKPDGWCQLWTKAA